MKRTTTLFVSGLLLLLTASFVLDGDDTSNIENKKYKLTITEAKKGGKSGAAEQDEAEVKGSKFRCKFFKQNAGAEAIPIELGKDSTYTEEGGEEVLMYVEFEGSMTNKLEEDIKVSGTIDGYGIEGFVEISKKGKVKKHWDFVGMEKTKKK